MNEVGIACVIDDINSDRLALSQSQNWPRNGEAGRFDNFSRVQFEGEGAIRIV